MLALDDPRWGELRHAYGAAGDIPMLLRALAEGHDRRDASRGGWSRDGVWSKLWSALCHQGDVYSASYAAVPHVVAIAAMRPPHEQAAFWSFVGAIAAAGTQASIPDALVVAYREAVAEAARGARGTLGEARADAIVVLWAIAELEGQYAIGRALEGYRDGEISFECPECDGEVILTLDARPFTSSAEHPSPRVVGQVRHPAVTRTPRREVRELAELACEHQCDEAAAVLESLDCDVTCPTCKNVEALLDAL